MKEKIKSYQLQYVDVLRRLLNSPLKKTDSRIGRVHSNFVELIRVDLQKEFPLMELKKIKFSNIVHELLWFIKGDTHIKYLIDNGCNIWNDDAYRYYKEKIQYHNAAHNTNLIPVSKEVFIENAKNNDGLMGELDRIYSFNWRSFNGTTDQLLECIIKLKTNPNDRRMIVTAHNPTDIEEGIVGLPSCHNMFQFYTEPLSLLDRMELIPEAMNDIKTHEELDLFGIPKYKLNIWFNIRSNDFFLGQPYNMASYALLCHIIGNLVNMIPNQIVCTAIDCHLYEEHFDAAKILIDRFDKLLDDNLVGETGININISDVTYCQSNIQFKKVLTSIDDINADDIELINYEPLSYIKAPLLT